MPSTKAQQLGPWLFGVPLDVHEVAGSDFAIAYLLAFMIEIPLPSKKLFSCWFIFLN